MSIDVNKLRATSKSVESNGGYCAPNQLGNGKSHPHTSGSINVDALKTTGKSVSAISGSVATNKK
jgi:hypothetical protein